MILRLSQKLSTKIKAGPLGTKPLDDNPFADWSAHLFVADRTQYIIVCNTKSLYATVLFGKGIANESHFSERALGSIREFMEVDGQAVVYHRCIAPASGTVSFAKALNRSVTGAMNDLINHAQAWLSNGELSPHDVGFKLNDVLLSSLASSEREKFGKPRQAFKAMVAGIKR